MTIEEAIEILSNRYLRMSMCPCTDTCIKNNTAIDMAISALRAQQEQESKSLNGWISVEDRLPEKNHAVLGWYKDNPFAGYTYGVVSWNGKGWVFVYAQRYVTNVTYWMPIPQPQKGE